MPHPGLEECLSSGLGPGFNPQHIFFVGSYTNTYKCLWLPWGFTFVVTYVCQKAMKRWALEDQAVAVKTCPGFWFDGLSGCAHSETITAPTPVYMQGQLLPFASMRHHWSWEKPVARRLRPCVGLSLGLCPGCQRV